MGDMGRRRTPGCTELTYRLFLEPLLGYIDEILTYRQAGETLTIIVPEFISNNRLAAALHMNTADLLPNHLVRQPGIVIINVPYHGKKTE